MKRLFLLILLIIYGLNLFSQEDLSSLMNERDEYYFEFSVDDNVDVAEISKLISIDNIDGSKIVAYANKKQYEAILTKGIKPELLTPPSLLHKCIMCDEHYRTKYDWNQYPTYEVYESMMYEFAEKYPDNCSVIELGTLKSGRKILAARINNGDVVNKPKFLYVSTIHGDETVGFVMMLRLINHLLTNPNLPEVDDVINNIDVFICPNANPDGTYYAGNHTVNGSKRYNSEGIDLNRNYPDYINGNHPDDYDYAEETKMFMKFDDEYQFTMSATYHGGAELINYPWDNNEQRHADDEWWQYVSKEYVNLAHEQNQDYMLDQNEGVTNGADWYIIDGSRQDYMNYYQQCRELTIECSSVKCPQSSMLSDYWKYNYNSMLAYMSQCLNGIHGRVVDAYTKNPVEATITIVNHDEDYSVVKSQLPDGDFHRPIKAGEYNVKIEAKGYSTVYKHVEIDDGERVELYIELDTEEFYNMSDDVVITCNAYFYDSGGKDGNYPNNDFHVMTFKPAMKGSMIQVEFLEFSTEENYDIIRVYDGSSVGDSPCIGVLSGTILPEIITATNAEGALTFRFLSDFATDDKGWKAIIRCVDPLDIIENDSRVYVYPNPVKDIVSIKTNNEDEMLLWVLYNTQGQEVMRSCCGDRNANIDVSGLTRGLYFLTIKTGDKQSVEKIVVE